MKSVGIKQTQGAIEISVLDGRQQFLREVRRRVVCDDSYVRAAVAQQRRKVFSFFCIHVDEIKMIERRRYFEGAGGNPFDRSPRPLRYVNASPAECIDVIFLKP